MTGRAIPEDMMHRFIANSTAAGPLGLPTGSTCLKVASGQFNGRVAVVFASAPSTLALVWADPPYSSFSSPVNIVTDAANQPFGAFISSSGDIYLAYTITGSTNLGFVKLTFSDGSWTVGSPVVAFDGGGAFYPSIYKLSTGYLWISYTRLSGGSYYVCAKVSGSDGAGWGVVSSPGDTLTAGAASAYSKVIEAGVYQYVFYNDGGVKIAYRSKLNAAAIWNSEVVLATGTGYNEHLTAAVNSDGRIALAFASSAGLKFREYSGSSWSGELSVDANECKWPLVSYQGGVPYVVFSRSYGVSQSLVLYSKKAENIFTGAAPLDLRASYLSKLVVYSSQSGSYQDRSSQAESTTTADVFHSGSGALLRNAGDAVYFGAEKPFCHLHFILSTTGTGGEVIWKYWDGSAWKSFTPSSGGWNFTSTDQDLLLWDDFFSIPGDWQKKEVSGNSLFWIAATVSSPFTVAPVGTQITTVSNLKAISGAQ